MAIENVINSENVALSNGGLAFHYAQTLGRPNRTWHPQVRQECAPVTICRNGFTMVLPPKALTKKGTIKKHWQALIEKLTPNVSLETAVALADEGVELAVA